MYRFLLTPRWLGYAALALLGVVVFLALGTWQFDRSRRVTLPVEAAVPGAAVHPIAEILTGPAVGGDSAGRLVSVTGAWDAVHQATLPDQVVGGRTGREVVTPLRRADGPALLVVRGFVPDGGAVPAPPAGPVTVTGWLAGSQAVPAVPAPTGSGQVGAVAAALFVNRVGYPLVDGYLGMTRADPGASAAGLSAVPLPGGGVRTVAWDWQNLGYAIQWNVFAIGAVAVLVIAARQHAREGLARADAELGTREVTF